MGREKRFQEGGTARAKVLYLGGDAGGTERRQRVQKGDTMGRQRSDCTGPWNTVRIFFSISHVVLRKLLTSIISSFLIYTKGRYILYKVHVRIKQDHTH